MNRGQRSAEATWSRPLERLDVVNAAVAVAIEGHRRGDDLAIEATEQQTERGVIDSFQETGRQRSTLSAGVTDRRDHGRGPPMIGSSGNGTDFHQS